VTLTNTSEETINDPGCPEFHGFYHFTVKLDGVPMQESKKAAGRHRWEAAYAGRCLPEQIKPGGSTTFWYDIDTIYDMSQAGTYDIIVSRDTDPKDPSKNTTITSAPLVIVVTKEEANIPKPTGPTEPLTLAAANTTFHVGEPVNITLIRKNTSEKVMDLQNPNNTMEWYDFDVSVGSVPAPEIELLKGYKDPSASFHVFQRCALDPGELYSSGVMLSDYYDMSKPGVYQVSARMKCTQCDSEPVIKSNTLTITVIPRGTPSSGNGHAVSK